MLRASPEEIPMKRIYTLALSDPSIIEIIAITIGIVSSVASFFYLFTTLAYQAGLSASTINPTGRIPGYISGFHQLMPLPSLDSIRTTAAQAFLYNLYGAKLEFWLIYIISMFITVYPITNRLESVIIPSMSIVGKSLGWIILACFIPIMLISLGYVSMFILMSASVYVFYFNSSIDDLFLSIVASISIFMVLATVIFYNGFIITGKNYFGALLSFLLSLGIDKIYLATSELTLLCIVLIGLNLMLLAIAVWRRWISV